MCTAIGALRAAVIDISASCNGTVQLPAWEALLRGQLPPSSDPDAAEPGVWRRGWQEVVTSAREDQEAQTLMASLPPGQRACVRSAGGPRAARWMTALPTEDALRIGDDQFRAALARRLGLQIAPVGDTCEGCGAPLDPYGYHRNTCTRTGRCHPRHRVIVQAWRRVFRESGITIPDRNVERYIRDTHLRRSTPDARRMDLVTPGIPSVFRGCPLFMDATCHSPVHGNGEPMPRAAGANGAVLAEADRRNREVDHPDVEAAPHAQLLCLRVETYGK